MDIVGIIASELQIKRTQVEAVFYLLDDGNTIPFIARYRKEAHGGLDDEVLRNLFARRTGLINLQERIETVINRLQELDVLTPELKKSLEQAHNIAEVEDLYRPYKSKRETRATIAKNLGLEPLAFLLRRQKSSDEIQHELSKKPQITEHDQLQGACDIIAESWAEQMEVRTMLRKEIFQYAEVVTHKKANANDNESVFAMYYDYHEHLNKIAPHRLLAIRRGEKLGIIRIKIELEDKSIKKRLVRFLFSENKSYASLLTKTLDDMYKRLLFPSISGEVWNEKMEQAETGAINLFASNLKQLLLAAPLKNHRILGFDPAFRTGCKLALIDEQGNVLTKTVIYPTAPHHNIGGAEATLLQLYQQYPFDYIALGNGTASRESDFFLRNFIKRNNLPIQVIIVNEAGASVYSASALGTHEFPDYKVEERSAVSIARRLLDPLAELVKIDPQAIGVGQYQHDMNQKQLTETLDGVVENCVNQVGIDLNRASVSLLEHVAALSNSMAENIIAFRNENGSFQQRNELLNVPRLGPKTYEQCVGFLRIPGHYPLENTGIHPESYPLVNDLLSRLHLSVTDIGSEALNSQLKELDLNFVAHELQVGYPTLKDIVEELLKPGRDPRDQFETDILRADVCSLDDLQIGMVLVGTVRNIMDFGAFVDIGVHVDGLVHISELANHFVRHPLDVVQIGQIVRVKIIDFDKTRNRISLSMRGVEPIN